MEWRSEWPARFRFLSSLCLHKSLSSANFSVSKHIIIPPPKLRQDISGIEVVSTSRVLPHQQWPLKGFALVGASFVTVNGRGEHPNAYMLHVYHISFFIYNTSYIMYHIFIYTHITYHVSDIIYHVSDNILYILFVNKRWPICYLPRPTCLRLTGDGGQGGVRFDWGHPNVEDP